MTAIEEFKQKIREGKLFDAFTLAVSEAIELKITTWVSSSNLETQAIIAGGKPFSESCLCTRINLVNGEIENEIGSEIINNQNYAELKKLHQEQVTKGRETILKNLEGLQKMFAIVGSTLAEIPKS
ncbi:MAG: hypothetical protein QNJ41_22530 [Xenococcaceae cyanobacterium MO_188.B32]|nr:hypothetical protein [Xenococcaceae cyanobacterium MO_188.B32]